MSADRAIRSKAVEPLVPRDGIEPTTRGVFNPARKPASIEESRHTGESVGSMEDTGQPDT